MRKLRAAIRCPGYVYPDEQGIYSTHEASDSEGDHTVMTKSGRQNRGWLKPRRLYYSQSERPLLTTHLLPRNPTTASACGREGV
jgi:hypothetical protein